jgi:TonB family protein
MRRVLSYALLAIAITESVVFAQPAPRQPPASSRRINGRDGDVVVINGDDRVTVVHRRQGAIRFVFDPVKHSLLLLADFTAPAGGTPDGLVDAIYTFADVTGDWPFGPHWEGTATVDEYWTVRGGRWTTVITTPAGAVQLKTATPGDFVYLEGAPPFTLGFRSSNLRTGPGTSFDDAERHADDPTYRAIGGVSGGVSRPVGGIVVSPEAVVSSPVRQQSGAPRQPVKLFDVKPAYPKAARDAGIAGNVVLQITVSADGAVTDARILRGIPELNDAALQAVRQWRYDMSTMNGPVTLIVTVPFGM